MADARRWPLRCLFFNTGRTQASELPARLGLRMDDRNDVICDLARGSVESVHGLWVAGNAGTAPLKLIITAASQGAVTGAKINSDCSTRTCSCATSRGLPPRRRPAAKGAPRSRTLSALVHRACFCFA